MKHTKKFNEFFQNIRPTPAQNEAAKDGHNTLRAQLLEDETLRPFIITTFLQGSYRRSTVNRPQSGDNVDVDLVVVGDFLQQYPPEYVLKMFEPFVERHYPGQWKRQGRSIGIKKQMVDLDLVVTRRPSDQLVEALAFSDPEFNPGVNRPSIELRGFDATTTVEELFEQHSQRLSFAENDEARARLILEAQSSAKDWMADPLEIPDRDTQTWEETHPLAQIEWTRVKNAKTNGFFVNIVRATKWWKSMESLLPKYPKSYPLEHMVGDCCPDDVKSVAEGFTETLEKMAAVYGPSARAGIVPVLKDRGCEEANVMARVDPVDFLAFIKGVERAAVTARAALESKDNQESAEGWCELFGASFPVEQGSEERDGTNNLAMASPAIATGGFTERRSVSNPSEGRFS